MRNRILVVAFAAMGLAGLALVSQAQQRGGDQAPGGRASEEREAPRALETTGSAVRILLGAGDQEPVTWDGKVRLDQGEILGVEGWRFREGDGVAGPDSWKARSLPIRRVAAKKAVNTKRAQPRKEEKGGPSNTGAAITPTGVVVRFKAPAGATLTLETKQGEAAIKLADLQTGAPKRYLDGKIEVRMTSVYAPVAATGAQEDFPSAVSDGKSGAWVAYVAHKPRGSDASEALTEVPASFKSFVPEGGGDQVKLLHFDGTKVDREISISGERRDVWRPAVALDGKGRVVVVWSEQVEGNWDLYARTLDPTEGEPSAVTRLTDQPGTDCDAVLTTYGDRVWMAWQTWIKGGADIWAAVVPEPGESPKKSAPIAISSSKANEWSPSIASGKGQIMVAYDTYEAGNYDVRLTSFGAANAPDSFKTVAVADSPSFEARPSLAVDSKGRAWVAYEERSANWGKDFGNIPDDPGMGLYQGSVVRVRCVEGGRVLDAGDPVANAPENERAMNAYARLVVDRADRPHLLFRHRQEAIWGNNSVMVVGGVWVELATAMVGDGWTPPQPLARSDNLLDNRPALVALPAGDHAAMAFYSGDSRLHREVEHTADLTRRFYTHSGTPPGVVNNDLFVALMSGPAAGSADPAPGGTLRESEAVAAAHPEEPEDVARLRSHRVFSGGKVYQLLRGEFHRHTEISQDGGNDGSLEDMWRYAIDAGRLDWIGNGDHDNGGGKEYTWWLIQKTTDLYHNAPAFMPMYTYERSVTYPGGHRNVMFPYRGVRTLPRLVDDSGVQTSIKGRDLDAQMLYKYLNELGGICAAHTSATGMGTDWRENDPKVEPFVEIYQGVRDSYEHYGAPRVAHGPGDAVGGWRPLGMVWNALAMQYKIGFQSSSDHVSTHISFAIAIAEQPTRQSIFDAFKQRHCYGATDNILLDVRCGDHIMGDEFTADGPLTFNVLAHGTGPIKKVDIIKDFHYVYSTEPGTARVEFSWTDDEGINRRPSWYYVRVLQENGEIAWGSPMWVQSAPGPRRAQGK